MNKQEFLAAAKQRPIAAAGAMAGLMAAGLGAIALTASAAAADAPANAMPGSFAPAGGVMGLEAAGFGPRARVHTVAVDEHGAPLSYTIARPAWFGLGMSYVTVASEAVVYVPGQHRIVRTAR